MRKENDGVRGHGGDTTGEVTNNIAYLVTEVK